MPLTDPTQDVKEIFGRAIEIESKSEQLAWLDDVCRGKPELRAEVDELLSALNETESFMVRPAVAARISDLHAQPPEAPRLPDHYRPVCEIARGGMGTVWRVVDEKFNRPMAVKTMLPETASDAAAIARFEREMQFTARLQHPAIPPVSDRGVLQGNDIPFFSMKLIEGKTLSKLLAERSDLQDDQSTYIDVFEQVCHAVGYAHSQRVVHRDLKPQNIMVGAFGEVQVMDWGMAKLVDEEVQSNELASPEVEIGPDVHELTTDTKASGESLTVTRAGQVMGTLTYMAPEQARGEIDAAGPKLDVFCLGGIF